MASDIHIDDFYADAARCLLALYGSFPRPVTIYVEDISGPDEPDEYGVHGARHQACFATLLWLAEEGYLRFEDTIRGDAVDQAVLTGRAFSVLHSVDETEPSDGEPDLPDTVRRRRSMRISRLQAAVAARSSSRIEAVVTGIMGHFAR